MATLTPLAKAAKTSQTVVPSKRFTVRWFRSLSLLSVIILFVLLSAIVAVAYYVISVDGKRTIFEQSENLTEQIGNNIVNNLLTEVEQIAALTRGQAVTASYIPKTEAAFFDIFPNILDEQTGSNIIGGGIFPAAYKFDASKNRDSFYWGKNLAGFMQFSDEYNQDFSNYFNEEWYASIAITKNGECAWSKSYSNYATVEPKVTCTVKIERDNGIFGAATIDYGLSGLDGLASFWQERTKGYIFIVDKDNRFISFPSADSVKKVLLNEFGQEFYKFATAGDYSNINPEFAPVMQALNAINARAVKEAKQRLGASFAEQVRTLKNASRSMTDEDAELKVTTLVNPLDADFSAKRSTLFAKVDLPTDNLLKTPSIAYLFHVPQTYWKVGVVVPLATATLVADNLSSKLLNYLLAGIAIIGLLAFLFLRFGILRPLKRTADHMIVVGDLITASKYMQLKNEKAKIRSKNEVGAVNASVNLLIDRIVENEGQLAEINLSLEHKVAERTHELSETLDKLRASQTQLVNSEKMAVLGQMVAGVAHEVNTPLGYVKNNVMMTQDMISHYDKLSGLVNKLHELMSDADATDDDISGVLGELTETAGMLKDAHVHEDIAQLFQDTLFGIEQISELVLNLKNFARLDENNTKDVNIHECIDSSLNIARNNIKHIEVRKNYGATAKVSCAPSQINQIFLNLFNNAAQAMPEGYEGIIAIRTYEKDGYVCIDISDNGKGMSKAVMSKIFEPFYTTKGAGEGTGLGLAICAQIIEQHQGKIQVGSVVGKGTKFRISLPIDKN